MNRPVTELPAALLAERGAVVSNADLLKACRSLLYHWPEDVVLQKHLRDFETVRAVERMVAFARAAVAKADAEEKARKGGTGAQP